MSFDPKTPLQLLKREITLDEALQDENNLLQELDYPQHRVDSCAYLLEHEGRILATVARHLNIDVEICAIADTKHWQHGTFNWCVPILINDCPVVVLRVPLLYKIGESNYKGNAEEKLRCEVATYLYLEKYCSDIPIPRLWGFGFGNGSSFAAIENCSFLVRWARTFHNWIRSIFRCSIPVPYVKVPDDLDFGFLLLEYMDNGTMLSDSFETRKGNHELESNLYKDLARILLSLARIPQPRIGSFTIDDRGYTSLSNRPLTCQLQMLENCEKISMNIDRKTTYISTADYVSDLLEYHDDRLLCQPNAINDEDDGRSQMAALTVMRTISHHMIDRNARNGPFYFTLTDLHQSNILVNEEWRITAVIDLEWAGALPSEQQQAPSWITGLAVDGFTGDKLKEYDRARDKFMSIFEREERLLTGQTLRTQMMQESWKRGSFWFFEALSSPTGLYNVVFRNILPIFSQQSLDKTLSKYWRVDADEVVEDKLRDREVYRERLIQKAISL